MPGPLPDTPLQERSQLRKKIAYGHVGAPYFDNVAVITARDAAEEAARSAHASSQAGSAPNALSRLAAAQSPEAKAAAYMHQYDSTLNTAGLQHMRPVAEYWAKRERLREVYNSASKVQEELRKRSKLEEALFALDRHLNTLVHHMTDGLLAYENIVFTTGNVPGQWEEALKQREEKFNAVLHGLRNDAQGENRLFPTMDLGFLSQRVTGAMIQAAHNGDMVHCKKMAGVLVTLDHWRAFILHVLGRRMLSLLQALRSKSKRLERLQHHTPAYQDAVQKNLEAMAAARDNMPPLALLPRMIHMGYSAAGCEPDDESLRIEARVVDFAAFVGERPDGFWARDGASAARAPVAPSS